MEDEAKLMRDKLTERFDRMMKVLFRQEGANLEIGILASEEAQDYRSSFFCLERFIPKGGNVRDHAQAAGAFQLCILRLEDLP